MGEVSFVCKRTLISTKPVEPGKFIPLSVLDRTMQPNHLRLVFYYNLPTRRRPGALTKKLRISIAYMLSSFPVAVGRLLRSPDGHWTIKCNDAGLRMTEFKVNTTVEEWLKNVDREKELKLTYWEDMYDRPYFWSTFYVQINEFECGGLAIGFSCSHMLSDPISATMMIKAWADMTLRGEIASPPVFTPLPSPTNPNRYKPNPNMISHYKSAISSSDSASERKQATITFHFDQPTVKKCIGMAGVGVAPFEALTALFWTSISNIRGVGSGLVEICVCLDARRLLGLERSFFGNCMVYKKVQQQGDELGVQLAEAAALIRETVSGIGAGDVMEVIEWLEREKSPLVSGGNLVSVDLENVGADCAVFEENWRLLHASYYIEPANGAGQLLIMPSPRGSLVSVTLPEDEAQKLLEDSLLLRQFAPTLIMGFKS